MDETKGLNSVRPTTYRDRDAYESSDEKFVVNNTSLSAISIIYDTQERYKEGYREDTIQPTENNEQNEEQDIVLIDLNNQQKMPVDYFPITTDSDAVEAYQLE